MIKLKSLITERYINLLSIDDRKKYVDIVWDMLQVAYAKAGGFKSAPDKETLLNDTFFWKLVRMDNKIVCGSLYKDKYGRKSIATFTDGTNTGKKSLFNMWMDDIKLGRSWSEVSGAVEHIKMKFKDTPIPNKYVSDIIGKPLISLNPDGYHYTRLIAGEPHEKILVGTVAGYNYK